MYIDLSLSFEEQRRLARHQIGSQVQTHRGAGDTTVNQVYEAGSNDAVLEELA
jgi:hypothetical protein